MTARESDCTEFEPLLDAWRDGELGSDERHAVEQHASSCLSCQGQLADIERVVATLRALPRVKPSRDFSKDIESLIAQRPAVKVLSFRPVVWGSLGAAAVAAAVAVVVFKLVPGFGPESAIVTRDRSDGTGQQRLHDGAPGQSRKEQTTELAHEKSGGDAPAVLKPPQGEKRSPGPDSVVANAPDSAQRVPQPPAAGGEGSSQGRNPAGGDNGSTGKAPENTGLPGSATPAVAPQKSAPRRVLNGRTAIAQVYDDDDPFSAGGAAVVALAAGDQSSITEQLGLATDEDGLYAIKM